MQLDGAPGEATTASGQEVSAVRGVAFRGAVVALNLSADGAGAAPQLLGNVVLAVPQPAHGGQGDALFRLQLLESSGHLDTLQGGEVLQFKLEPA
jgi:hypothetical protein